MQCSMVSLVEDVLQHHGKSFSHIDLASRKAHEAALRRNEAAGWLRKMVGVVGGRDLPDQPSEEEFRLALRSGIVLCNVLNKVQPGAVPKVVEAPNESIVVPDGAALSVFQYFENVRNFLVSVEDMGVPSFEASDLEKGGNSSRIVNCILALKSYCNWKQAGGSGLWKFGGNQKPSSAVKQFIRRNAGLFTNSLVRNTSTDEKSIDSLLSEESTSGDVGIGSLTSLVHELLQDKKQEDIPLIVESMLSKVMEEFEHKITLQNDQLKTVSNGTTISDFVKSPFGIAPNSNKNPTEIALHNENGAAASTEEVMEASKQGKLCNGTNQVNMKLKSQFDRRQMLTEKYQRDIQELKNICDAVKGDVHVLKTQYQEEVDNLGKHLHGLTHAAKGYKSVLEENRKLYNLVQDLKGNIRVYCRVRPFLPGQANSVTTVGNLDDGNITITSNSKYGKESRKTFTFNKVFGSSATQEEVFSDTQPLIRSVLDGYNVCIFAYGQTGSGKTYTMSGPNDITDESAGVNYRALGDLFLISEQRRDTIAYDVSVQMIEIYNEQVRDLLATDSANKRYPLVFFLSNGINVPDANIVPVTSTSDVIALMNLGQKNRAVGSTAMNDRSSRSHSCLTVHVQGRDLTSGSRVRGCMHLVDLAGSERVEKSEVVGDRLKEAQHINRSLSALGDVIASLAQKNAHVPYRNSKLTQLLQDSLGGQAKTLMFVHISPEPDAVLETLSTLKFAERVSNVELGAAKVNKDNSEVRELKEQISNLTEALARKDGDSRRCQSLDVLSDHSQCTDDAESIEVRSNSSKKTKRRTLDSQALLTNSPPSPPIGSPISKYDDKDSLSDDWVDKVIINKVDRWEEDSRQSSEIFGDIDDIDTATAASDSSEPECVLQTKLRRLSSLPNGVGSGITAKKTGLKLSNGLDKRGLIPTPPRRRISNGISPLSQKTGRSPASLDGKRKPVHAK
ncbi:microtubule binding motor protein [Lithospermum erythrorhizon]|uniref:Microtubule binding motor protein n=1 Tax=Lithospermum erythrorhizon TaxID=34254 RepID=A0AAV3NP91_LITER